jgi:hypothetical protein
VAAIDDIAPSSASGDDGDNSDDGPQARSAVAAGEAAGQTARQQSLLGRGGQRRTSADT